MPKKGFSEEQIAFALRQAESGTPVGEICRRPGLIEQRFYATKKLFVGMGISKTRRMKQLDDENTVRRRRVPDPGSMRISWRFLAISMAKKRSLRRRRSLGDHGLGLQREMLIRSI